MAQAADNPVSTASPSITEPEARGKAVLITVHGTGAGAITATGDSWWQLGSAFLTQLSTRLDIEPSRVELFPFQWSDGPNSEKARREAGKALLEKLKAYDEAGTDCYVIGHSHGGSVVYSALLQSAKTGTHLSRLKYWCTVGTPFLDYRENRFLFQRLESLGLTFYTTAIVAFVLGLLLLLQLLVSFLFRGTTDPDRLNIGSALALYGVATYSGLRAYEWFRKRWFTLQQKQKVEQLYSRLWMGLWHPEDEAISALSNIRDFSAAIVPADVLRPLVGVAQLGLVLLVGFFFAADAVFHHGASLKALFDELQSDEVKGYWGTTLDNSFTIVLLVAFLLVALYLASRLLIPVLKILGRPVAAGLNRVIWSSIRKRAWGDDVLKEDVRGVASRPPEFHERFGPLPEVVAAPLRGHSEKHAITTLRKVREVLGMTQESKPTTELRSELAETLTWQELIHTSYFDVPEFIDLVALGLGRAGLAGLRDEFDMTPERAQLGDWCRGLPATDGVAGAR